MNHRCIALMDPGYKYKISPYLETEIELIVTVKFKELLYELRSKRINCVIFFICGQSTIDYQTISILKKRFPTIPLLSIHQEKCLETVRKLGQVGVDRVIHYSEIDNLSEIVFQLITKRSITISLKKIGITELKYTRLVNEALQIIELHYINLMGVQEIARILDIDGATLSREFKKNDLPGPKRILMYMKVHHAALLMKNSGLNKGEIASMAGFSSIRNMSACFL